jgi:hypothetical protein
MMSGANAFLDLADRQIAAPVKARQLAAEQRRAKALDKKDEDRSRLAKAYERHRQEQIEEALAGSYGAQLAALIAALERVTRHDDGELVHLAAPWCSADADARFLVLRLVGDRIVKLREAAGLPPLDDPLPGQPLTPFLQIRDTLQ